MCPICVRDCVVLREISKSAFRGREVLYPVPEAFRKGAFDSRLLYPLWYRI